MLRMAIDFIVEHVLSVPKDVFNNFLDEHRLAGALQLVPAQSWSADYKNAPSTRLQRLPDTVYTRWPYVGKLSAASTRIRVGRRSQQPALARIDSEGVATIPSAQGRQHSPDIIDLGDVDSDDNSDTSGLPESISVQTCQYSARLKGKQKAVEGPPTASTSATPEPRKSQRLENHRLISSCPNCKGKRGHCAH
uniref:Uncharacterized protein n=1 Tax=Psilocybe cubensis TaxID=181762 RepID=A0A8H7XNV5_PSICU